MNIVNKRFIFNALNIVDEKINLSERSNNIELSKLEYVCMKHFPERINSGATCNLLTKFKSCRDVQLSMENYRPATYFHFTQLHDKSL